MSDLKDIFLGGDTDNSITTNPSTETECGSSSNNIVKNTARLEFSIDNDSELATNQNVFSTPVQFCITPQDNRSIVGLKLFCAKRAYVGEIITVKIVAVNKGNVGLTNVFTRDNLPSGLSYQDQATVEVFDSNGNFVPPMGMNAYTLIDATPSFSNNVLLKLVRKSSPVSPYTLAPGWFAVFSFKVKILTTGDIRNSASVGAYNTTEDPSNEIVVTGHNLALTISKSIKGATPCRDFCVSCGQSVTYQIIVANPDNNTLRPTSFTITDMFESVFQYTSTKITFDGTNVTTKFLITPPNTGNFNTLTITSNKFTDLNPGKCILVEVTGRIRC